MKNILTYATLAVLAIATVFVSCDRDDTVRVTGVTLNAGESNLPVPYTDTLIATITPANATNQTLIWTSSNDAFATISENGALTAVITAVSEGPVTITVTTECGDFSASRTFEIQPQYFPVTGLTLNYNEWTTHALNATFTLEATIAPENASFQDVDWTSSNEDVATVVDGLVTSIGEGTATIRAASVRSPEIYAEATVTVELIPVASITVNREDNITLHFWGEEAAGALRLVSTPLPMNASNRAVVWTSSDPSVVAVRSPQFNTTTAIVDARGVGTAILRATAADGSEVYVTRTVTVSDNPNMVPDFCLDNNMTVITSARFLTDETWEVGDFEWSDVVISDQCAAEDSEWNPADHGGALATGFMTHCRQSADGLGHGFTWCAVMRFHDILCPGDWRVPVAQDFINLDIALGGEGLNVNSGNTPSVDDRLTQRFVPDWGLNPIGSWNPLALMGMGDGYFQNTGISGFYWSMTEVNDASGRAFNLVLPNPASPTTMRTINPVATHGKGNPAALRCVRNR